jgi:hypothetical protein
VAANGDDGYITGSTKEYTKWRIIPRVIKYRSDINATTANPVNRIEMMWSEWQVNWSKRNQLMWINDVWSISQLQMLLPASFWTFPISTAREKLKKPCCPNNFKANYAWSYLDLVGLLRDGGKETCAPMF